MEIPGRPLARFPRLPRAPLRALLSRLSGEERAQRHQRNDQRNPPPPEFPHGQKTLAPVYQNKCAQARENKPKPGWFAITHATFLSTAGPR